MLTVKVYTTKEDPKHSASLIESESIKILAIIPRHWPENELRIERLQEKVNEVEELTNAGHALGLMSLQSERYSNDSEYRYATDEMLAILRKVGKL